MKSDYKAARFFAYKTLTHFVTKDKYHFSIFLLTLSVQMSQKKNESEQEENSTHISSPNNFT